MHIWQAIKMACKSLWTNKLRSALTMLGIIIGVMTVALLTSVASSVKTAIVSEIRTQSTLSIVMCTSNDMTYKKVDDVLKGNQHKPSDDDYYSYSMIYSSNAVVSEDLTGIEEGMFDENFLRFNHIIVTEEEYNKILDKAYTLPYGELLVDFLNTFVKAFVEHTHNFSMLPPNTAHTATLISKKNRLLDDKEMLSNTVRIN